MQVKCKFSQCILILKLRTLTAHRKASKHVKMSDQWKENSPI